jgi:type II secretory ATPase GspE/PulE/Tfp pilus assembly ATPase PilB-like protein
MSGLLIFQGIRKRLGLSSLPENNLSASPLLLAQAGSGNTSCSGGAADSKIQADSNMTINVTQKKSRILTRDGEKYAQPAHIQKLLCFLDDNRLFVSKTHTHDPYVAAFRSLLKREGVSFTEHSVALPIIESLYNSNDYSVKSDDSRNQYLVRQMIDRAVELRSSDIHIRVSSRSGCQIYFRIHNDLEFQQEHPFEFGKDFCSTIYQAMTDVSDSTFNPSSRQDARISDRNKLNQKLDGVRVATSPQVDGFLMVLRLLYNDTTESTSLVELGYHVDQAKAIEFAKKRPTGLNIISGPTGSGKSTTLQRVLTGIIQESSGRKHVITVEDPPEYPIPHAVQTPVANADTEEKRSMQFQLAIKSALRLDPDVIMIGEMRDSPSVRLALQAAMTGHQVWTTLHANNAMAIVDRLSDLGVSLEVLTDSSIINSLTCQRLLKVLCPHCKEPLIDVTDRYKESDVRRIMTVTALEHVFVKGGGCDHCNRTGIVGRTVVAETVITDQKLMEYLRKKDRIAAIDYWRRDQSAITMLEHAIHKVSLGVVDPFDTESVIGPLTLGNIERDHSIDAVEVANLSDFDSESLQLGSHINETSALSY